MSKPKLKLRNGTFYASHTDDLRSRLSEHRDGKVKSIKGFEPQLQYFIELPTREEATSYEADLKKLCDKNPRALRRMITTTNKIL